MILRKSPSQFLRVLRSLPPDELPMLPEKRLSRRQMRRLNALVAARILAADDVKTDKIAYSVHSADPDTDTVWYDDPYLSQPLTQQRTWMHTVGGVLAACMLFCVLTLGVLFRGNIAMFLTELREGPLPAVTETETASAIETLPPPENASEEFSMRVDAYHRDGEQLRLDVTLTSLIGPLEGISIQYDRLMLEIWDPEVRVWRMKYDVFKGEVGEEADKLEIIAGDLDFDIHEQGAVEQVSAILSVPHPQTDYTGVYRVSLSGISLVRDVREGESSSRDLIVTTLTDGIVSAVFSTETGETPAPEDTTAAAAPTLTPPPELLRAPGNASETYSLLLADAASDGDTVTLDLVLTHSGTLPDGYAVYYNTGTVELWDAETQTWQEKSGNDYTDVPFAAMLMAGDVQFVVDDTASSIFAALPFHAPGSGWFRVTLTGLVLVREAREGEESDWSLICETLDEGSVSVVFFKE